jgi:hypothetical protein
MNLIGPVFHLDDVTALPAEVAVADIGQIDKAPQDGWRAGRRFGENLASRGHDHARTMLIVAGHVAASTNRCVSAALLTR